MFVALTFARDFHILRDASVLIYTQPHWYNRHVAELFMLIPTLIQSHL